MRETTDEGRFIDVVSRLNRYLIIMSIFFLMYFLLKAEVDTFLFLLALSYVAFAFLSHKHLTVTNRLAIELERARIAMKDVVKETSEMRPD